jgi:hypothetical protein
MNYLTEIRLFYEWLETHHLAPSSITLWHALMYTANRSGWAEQIAIPISILESRTQMTRSTIYRSREQLVNRGLIGVEVRGSSFSAIYKMFSLENMLMSQYVSQNVSQNETQSGTQNGTPTSANDASVSQNETQSGNIYRVNRDSIIDNNSSSKSSKSKRENSPKEKKFSIDEWAKAQESPWRELMLIWLDYKRTRKESYRSEMGAKKCLTLLRNLSGGSAELAQRIIDQSMANNWAGLFALKESPPSRGQPPGRAHGQRVGQIIQSTDEDKRQRFIDRLKNAGKK